MRKIFSSLVLAASAVLFGGSVSTQAQVVPGTGQRIVEVGDDFEDQNWTFTLNLPKASSNIDKVVRSPSGFSSNSMWFESDFRGTPDFVKRVETPEGGLSGSTGALAMQSLYTGIPGQLSHKMQQDDLIANVQHRLGYMLPASWTPSYVVRVYMPPFEKWEQRVGSSFGFRADCQTIINKPTKAGKFFRTGGTTREIEQYWPGFFIQYNGKTHPQHTDKNTATILIRSGERGQDIPGPVITQAGWWTLGMTITPDGRVHYYAHEGVEDLKAKDHLYSNFPYGYTCLQTSTYFFNIVNQDDGRSWSTRWIVDDPKVYVATGSYVPSRPQVAQVPATPVSQTKTTPEAPAANLPSPPAAPTTSNLPLSTTPTPPTASPATIPLSTTPALNPSPVATQNLQPQALTIPSKLPVGKFDAPPLNAPSPVSTTTPPLSTVPVTPTKPAQVSTPPVAPTATPTTSVVPNPTSIPTPAAKPVAPILQTAPTQALPEKNSKSNLEALGPLLSNPIPTTSASPAAPAPQVKDGGEVPKPDAAAEQLPSEPKPLPSTPPKEQESAPSATNLGPALNSVPQATAKKSVAGSESKSAEVIFKLPILRSQPTAIMPVQASVSTVIENGQSQLPELSKKPMSVIPSASPAPALLPIDESSRALPEIRPASSK